LLCLLIKMQNKNTTSWLITSPLKVWQNSSIWGQE
jgi:hypothetical protein